MGVHLRVFNLKRLSGNPRSHGLREELVFGSRGHAGRHHSNGRRELRTCGVCGSGVPGEDRKGDVHRVD